MVRVKYADNSIDTFSYNETYPESSGICITQRMECAFKQGDKINRGDIVVYNKEFFSPNKYNKQVDWKHGVHATCAIMERNNTLQDSSCITRRLGEKLRISPTQIRTIALDKDCVIHDIVNIGKMVYNTDHLIVFEENEIDDYGSLNNKNPKTIELLKKLNRSMPKAKYSGHVIKIDAYYGCDIGDMHPSLGNIVKEIVLRKNALHKFTLGTDKSLCFPMSSPLPKNIKFKGIDMTENTVILQIYIKEDILAGVGDKLVFDASLKTVIGEVIFDPILSETGVEIDAVFSGQSINNRIITSPLIVGTSQRVVEKIESDILEIWNS